MSVAELDDVTILAMRICATRHDAMVSGEAFIGMLRQLLRTAVAEAVAAVTPHKLAEPTADKPAAPEPSVAAPVVGTAPASLSGVPAPSQPARLGRKSKISDADREQVKRDYLAVTANGAKVPYGWFTKQAKKIGCVDSAIHYIVGPLHPKPNAHTVPPTADVATIAIEPAAPRRKPRESSKAEQPGPVSAPPEPEPEPKCKPTLKHREFTAAELAELERRCNIVTNDLKLRIPHDWARQRGDELGVPSTTIFAVLTKPTTAPPAARKERDPMKALAAPQPRVRRLYGKNYGPGGGYE